MIPNHLPLQVGFPFDNPGIPCGDERLGGNRRLACTFVCCIKPVPDETDSEWSPHSAATTRRDAAETPGTSYSATTEEPEAPSPTPSVVELKLPTPGSSVKKDDRPDMAAWHSTPVRGEPDADTPDAKKPRVLDY